MKLSPQDVKARYKAGRLKIALFGMSNIGKSHLAGQLVKKFGFVSTEVDAVIQSHLGKANMNDHAAWLGQPYSDGYDARERDAIGLETRATSEAIDNCLAGNNTVLDAPGSVIYVDAPVLTRIKESFWCLYLEAASTDIERLKQLYYTHPKPLIWNNNYNPSIAERPDDAVMASYEGLLHERAQTYKQISDMTLQSGDLFSGNLDLAQALGLSD